jgi:predicted extracellular nuclease
MLTVTLLLAMVAALLPTLPLVAGAVSTSLVINEVDYDQPGTDAAEFLELKNVGTSAVDLSGWTVELVNGSGGGAVVYDTISLPAVSLAVGGYFVVCANATTTLNCDLDDGPDTNFIQNGSPDGIGLRSSGVLVDAVSYEGDTGAPYTEGSGTGLDDAGIDGSIGRCADGGDTDQNNVDFAFASTSTPGATNACPIIPPTVPLVKIHEVQGNGAASPLVGQTVKIEGIVVGDFQDGASGTNGDLNGFYIQEEDADADADSATSEGIFVFNGSNPAVNVQIGDLVGVEGAVSEFNDMTEMTSFTGVAVLSSGNALPTASILSLPVFAVDDFEPVEGMYVTFPQDLVIAEYFNFDRFGEMVLTSERHLTPTAEFEPGPAAIAAVNEFLLDKITLDDGRTNQNPDPAIHPNGSVFDLNNLFRGGDTVANVTGVMDYSFGLYRIQPTQGADYTNTNVRTAAPDEVGGNIQVASFNVLNYFSTLDDGVNDICGPALNQECRGADNAEEFTRQRDKIIAAISAMDADVVGLLEIENNVNDDAVIDLVNGLNVANGAGTYDYVATDDIGTDAIKVALIYKPASVDLVGAYSILDSSVDARFDDTKNRPVLAQTFMDSATGGIFTVAVNHLKSKGSACDDVGDPDLGDGAGNCNLTREAAAQALVDWLAADPTGSGDEDFLIIGDLNSYDKEDPIDAILAGADDTLETGDDYTDLIFSLLGEDAYSYVFNGQTGYLDHALANAGLLDEITGVTVWHINADEADLIDYDTSFKLPAQDALYAPDPYRSSDHDPVIVGLNVCDEIAPTIDALSVTPNVLRLPNHKYVNVEATIVVGDNFDTNPTVTLVSVTSDEPDNGEDDGDTVNDIVIVDDFHFKLRAERSGVGQGRTYTITYEVTDACGNTAVDSVTVFVPLSQGE